MNKGEPTFWRVKGIIPDAMADRTLVTLQDAGSTQVARLAASPAADAVPPLSPAAEVVSPATSADRKQQLSDVVTHHISTEADRLGVSRNTKAFKDIQAQMELFQQLLVVETPPPEVIAHLKMIRCRW